MPRRLATAWVAGVLLFPATAAGQPDPPPDPPTAAAAPDPCALPPSLRFTLEALGASSGVPDGLGSVWYPTLPVRGQPARMGLVGYEGGLSAPVYQTDADGLFVNGAVRGLEVRTTAHMPGIRGRFPPALWDVQFGGAYVRQLGTGWSWGVCANAGSASDQPFHGVAEDTASGLAFLRVPRGEQMAWLFYVVSTTNGQFGHNIPIPGVAYEFQGDRLSGVVGFPFVTITYRPLPPVECEFYYAALTDLSARVTYHPLDPARVFAGFEWANQSWLPVGRRDRWDQLFWYEKRVEGGLGWAAGSRAELRVSGGYAFDRYFVVNNGFSVTGRNRLDLATGPFATARLELRY